MILLTACSSTYKIPTARLMSPEASGQSHAILMGGYHQAERVTITPDIATVSANSSTHDVQTFGNIGGLFSYGLFDSLDVGFTADFWMPSIVFAKWQLLGKPKSQADAGNFSFSLLAGLGGSSRQTETSYDPLTNQDGTLKRDSSTVYQGGGLMGYRPSKGFLILFGGTYTTLTLKGTQTLAGNATPIVFKDDPQYYEFHGGLQLSFGSDSDWWFQPMLYHGFLRTFGHQTQDTTVSLDLGCQF